MNTPGLLVILAAALAYGCAPKYRAPPPETPHALVHLRAVYHVKSEAPLSHSFKVDGRKVVMSAPRRVSSEPLEKLVRVTAERHRFDVMSEFSYTDVTQQRGPTVARESGSCPADTGCGEPRVEERYNWGSEYVTEARCAFQLTLTPEAGRTYHLQYDFYGDQRCTLKLLASE